MLRRTPLARGTTPLVRRTPMMARVGLKATAAKPARRARYTGPSDEVRAIVWTRSGGRCEFPSCGQLAQDPHHRYERGNGGTGRKGPAWINDPVNILAACRHHNDWVSNQQPHEAWVMGWRLKKHEVPHQTPVQTCHEPMPIWLTNDGRWLSYEEGAA